MAISFRTGASQFFARRTLICWKGVGDGGRPGLVGGGLIRSLGGWKAAKAVGGIKDRIKGDERILGDGDFIQSESL